MNPHRLTVAAVIAALLASTLYVVLSPGDRRTATLEFTLPPLATLLFCDQPCDLNSPLNPNGVTHARH